MPYLHERKDWPEFSWDQTALATLLADVRYSQGKLIGRMRGLGFSMREQASLQTLTQDVLKTTEIEGEKLDARQVRSSLATRLGIDAGAIMKIDRNVEGIVEVMLDATGNYDAPMTEERLFGWHAALFPMGRSGMERIVVGGWRTDKNGPMQVVSGPYGREKVHYEAPASERIPTEMSQFIDWFDAPAKTDLVLKAALAHFWFVSIHPFEDGNGRIARAIADMTLARTERSSQRFYSMSSQIQRERNTYYNVLETCQKGTMDITPWMDWFLNCLKRAIGASEETLRAVLLKSRFWEAHAQEPFNDRQRLILSRLQDGFRGKLTSSKWAKLGKCSHDTALRDINDLVNRQILIKTEAGGRSTSYELKGYS